MHHGWNGEARKNGGQWIGGALAKGKRPLEPLGSALANKTSESESEETSTPVHDSRVM